MGHLLRMGNRRLALQLAYSGLAGRKLQGGRLQTLISLFAADVQSTLHSQQRRHVAIIATEKGAWNKPDCCQAGFIKSIFFTFFLGRAEDWCVLFRAITVQPSNQSIKSGAQWMQMEGMVVEQQAALTLNEQDELCLQHRPNVDWVHPGILSPFSQTACLG